MRGVAVRLRLVATTALLSAALGTAAGFPDSAHAAAQAPSQSCETFTFRPVGIPAATNPFDPNEISVEARFRGDREYWVPAFYTRDYARSLGSGGQEILQPQGSPYWAVRFTPPSPGRWNWTLYVYQNGQLTITQDQPGFDCEPAGPGLLRRSAEDPRQLERSDGSPYAALGENVGWYGQGGTFDYDHWLDRLQSSGATWIRVWMASWSVGLEWLKRDSNGQIVSNTLGNYTDRLDRAWQLDYIIEAARSRGIEVQLVIQNHGAFSLSYNSEWANNPYNSANGGPISDPGDFFTDPTAKELFKRRLRYTVARWGYAPNVTWELWNEVDLTAGTIPNIVSWHDEMLAYLESIDSYPHLRTTSISNWFDFIQPAPQWSELWSNPRVDLVQIHVYGQGQSLPLNFAEFLPTLVRQAKDAYGKPVLVGEAGVDWQGPSQTLAADPESRGIHEIVWGGLFSGAYGAGMNWWWDNIIDPQNLYGMLGSPRKLLAEPSFPLEGAELSSGTARRSDNSSLSSLEIRRSDSRLLWIRNPSNWWLTPDTSVVSEASVTISGLTPGFWRMRFYDPYSGNWTGIEKVIDVASNEAVDVGLPDFQGELAARLDRIEQRLYMPEGAAVDGLFETWVLVANPLADRTSSGLVRFLLPEGPSQAVYVELPPLSRRSLRIGSYLQSFEVATEISVLTGRLLSERSLYSTHPERPGSTLSKAQDGPSTTWYLTEGAADGPFETWVLLMNPDPDNAASADLTFLTDSGARSGPRVVLPPLSRRTVRVNDHIGSPTFHVSTRVDSDIPVVAERVLYKRNPAGSAISGAATSSPGRPAGSRDLYLPEGSTSGFETWWLIANPSVTEEALVTLSISGSFGSGDVSGGPLVVGPSSRVSIRANSLWPDDPEVGAELHSSIPILAETAQYGLAGDFADTAHSFEGIDAADTAWSLPEGVTAGGFKTFVLILNPNDQPAGGRIDVRLSSGSVVGYDFVVQPRGRETILLDDIPAGSGGSSGGIDDFETASYLSTDLPVVAGHTILAPAGLSGDSISSAGFAGLTP